MPYIDVADVIAAFAEEFANANIAAFQEMKIKTTRENMKDFSHKEVKGAPLARIAQTKMAQLPDAKFKQLLSSSSF